MELTCEPVFDYGRIPGGVVGATRTATAPTSAPPTSRCRLQTDMTVGVEGDWVRARHV